MEPRREPPGPPATAPSSGRTRAAGILLILGGGLLASASWLDLGTAEGPGYMEALPAGETFEGGAFLAAGLAFLVAGVVVWGHRVDRHSRLVGLGSILGAGATLWLATAAALAVGRETGRLGPGFEVGLGWGLYLAVVGSGLALVGGGLALFWGGDRSARPAPGFGSADPRDPWAWTARGPGAWEDPPRPAGRPAYEETDRWTREEGDRPLPSEPDATATPAAEPPDPRREEEPPGRG